MGELVPATPDEWGAAWARGLFDPLNEALGGLTFLFCFSASLASCLGQQASGEAARKVTVQLGADRPSRFVCSRLHPVAAAMALRVGLCSQRLQVWAAGPSFPHPFCLWAQPRLQQSPCSGFTPCPPPPFSPKALAVRSRDSNLPRGMPNPPNFRVIVAGICSCSQNC